MSVKRRRELDVNIESDNDSDEDFKGKKRTQLSKEDDEDEEHRNESADAKRLRLAKEYLEKMKQKGVVDRERERDENDESDKSDGEGSDGSEDSVTRRLKSDSWKTSEHYFRWVSSELNGLDGSSFTKKVIRPHSKTVTSVALTTDGTACFSGSKDCCIAKIDIETGKKQMIKGERKESDKKLNGHTDHILTLAVSDDMRFVVSGGADKTIRVWDTRTLSLVRKLEGHRDDVLSVSFRKRSCDLYTASSDRSIKVWDGDGFVYVDTLFGHQSDVVSIHGLNRPRIISGGRDMTVRLWKIPEQTQLVFRGHTASVDAVHMISAHLFISGSQDGSVCLWDVAKKKPIWSCANAHHGKWISAIGSVTRTDVMFTASSDGFIRSWSLSKDKRALVPLNQIPVTGFVNSIDVEKNGKFLVAGVGQEHKFGRWEKIQQAKNSVEIIQIPLTST
eukprot:c28577_g1_i1.p1 GENE.c28577_g1_i1~~c28577_g1_i1.p1  ORF type:complete len:456 (-),score=191.47 c28577_g1_i1:20-1360(-)